MMNSAPPIEIDPLSARSLRLRLTVRGRHLAFATGFIVMETETPYLVTNWHVLAGRNPDTNQLLSNTGATPDTVRILHHLAGPFGSWTWRKETLYDAEGNPRWVEHPQGQMFDVVALPLRTVDDQVDTYPLDLSLAETDMVPRPGMPVFIVGFPLGLATAGALPIWKTGHIASDPDVDYGGRPAFLIDATTREGMSGSPVVLRLSGGFETQDGRFILAGGGFQTRFLGVYSGRIHRQAEVGMVWRPRVIGEILRRASNK